MKSDNIFMRTNISTHGCIWEGQGGIALLLLIVAAMVFIACPAEHSHDGGDVSPPEAPLFNNIGKSITWVKDDGAISLQYREPKDKDFDHVEITAIPKYSRNTKKILTHIVKKGSSERRVIMRGFTANTQYEISVVSVDKSSNKSKAMKTRVFIGADTTSPDKHGLTVMSAITQDSLVFTWNQPQDKSIQQLRIILQKNGGNVITKYALITEKRLEIKYEDNSLVQGDFYTVNLAYMDNNGNWEENPSSLLHNKPIALQESSPIDSVEGLVVDAETPEQLMITWQSPVPSASEWVILDVQEKGGNAVGLLSSGGLVMSFQLKGAAEGAEKIEGENGQSLTLTASTYGIVGSKAYKVKARVYNKTQALFSEIVSAESENMKDGVVNVDINKNDITLAGGNNKLFVRWKSPKITPSAIQKMRVLPDFRGVRLTLLGSDSKDPIETLNIKKGVYKHVFKNIDQTKQYTVKMSVYDEGGAISTGVEKKTDGDTFSTSTQDVLPSAPQPLSDGKSLEEKPGGYVDIQWRIEDEEDVDTIVITPVVIINDKEERRNPVTVDATVASYRFGPYKHGDTIKYSIMAVDFDGQESDALMIPQVDPYVIDNEAPISQVPITRATIDGTFTVQWTPKEEGDVGIFNIYTNKKKLIHTFRYKAISTEKRIFTVIPKIPSREQLKRSNLQLADIMPGESYIVTLQIADSIGNISKMKSNEAQARGISILTNPDKVTNVMTKTNSRTSDSVTVQWNVPSNLGREGETPVPSSDVRYNVIYVKGTKDMYGTYQKLLKNDKKLVSTPIISDKDILETTLTRLEPGTKYVVMVQTENIKDVSKVSFSDVQEIRTLQKMEGDIIYQKFISVSSSGDTINPRETITTKDVKYSISPVDDWLTIDENSGDITVQKSILSEKKRQQYTITATKQDYETKTTTLSVYGVDSEPKSLFDDIEILNVTGRINGVVVRWKDGNKEGSSSVSDILYRIHYAWIEADKAEVPKNLKDLQAMSNYRVELKSYEKNKSQQKSVSVTQRIGANKTVYVYIQAITRDASKSTLSNMKSDTTKSGYKQLAAGLKHTIALTKDGTVWTWGWNEHGQLGSDDFLDKSMPTQVNNKDSGELTFSVIAIAAGNRHTVALADDGSVWTWGSNEYGQLGNSDSPDKKNHPEQVKGAKGEGNLSNIAAIAAGGAHTVALTKDGTVWTWGSNSSGQLGVGSRDDSNYPVQVKGAKGAKYLSDIKAISAGGSHTVALTKNGTVWTWGSNSSGQLGVRTKDNSKYPVQVKGAKGAGYLSNIKAIAAGGAHTVALTENGTVWTWGKNRDGQLGNGNNDGYSSSPVQVVGLDGRNITSIVAGKKHTVALADDGSVWAWGINANKQLGDDSNKDDSNRPVQMKDIPGREITLIVAGEKHTVALTGDGTVWALGRNHNGQLGDGTDKDRNVFVSTKE